MTKETIASFAEMEINRICSGSDYLKTDIKSFSNEPSWDGNIYYYPNTNSTKKGLVKIDIQIKGMIDNGNNAYSFDVEDLNNYMNNSGVILCVVKITENEQGKHKSRILMKLLMPNDLKKLLKDVKQKTITIKPKQVFTAQDVMDLCKVYGIKRTDSNLGNKNQILPINTQVNGIRTIMSDKVYEGIIISPKNEEQYLSLETKNGDRYYFDKAILEAMDGEFGIKVISNGSKWYNKLKVIKANEEVIITFSDVLKIILRGDNTWTMDFGINNPIGDVIYDFNFIESIVDDTFYIGDNPIRLDNISRFNLEHNPMKEHIDRLRVLNQYLVEVEGKQNVNVFAMTEQEQMDLSGKAIEYNDRK